jgi:DMSO reductase anchor subunit
MAVSPARGNHCRVTGSIELRPPLSMVFFTTLAGAGQGLMLVLCALELLAVAGLLQVPRLTFIAGAAIVLVLGGVGLVAASFHLGHPWRGWRAVAMWRSSWLSREVIVLPLFLAAVLAWGLSQVLGTWALGWGVLAAVLAVVLFVCTGMIYAAVKAMREWATPLTPLNYSLIGLASGALLALALVSVTAPALRPALSTFALLATLLAAAVRAATLWRNKRLAPQDHLAVGHWRAPPAHRADITGGDGRLVQHTRVLSRAHTCVCTSRALGGGVAGLRAASLGALDGRWQAGAVDVGGAVLGAVPRPAG